MKRLTDKELETRIHNFMIRKLEEFPELRDDNPGTYSVHSAREHTDLFRSASRFTLHWRQPRVA